MKVKHNKFRNTGLIYELLVKQVAADTLSSKDSPAISILKKFYTGNTVLVKEFKLYDFILKNKGVSREKAETILSTITELSRKFNQGSLKKIKYNLIKEIKEHYNIDEFFSIKVRDYKPLAGLYCLIEAQNNSELVDPDIFVNNRLTLLEHLTSRVHNTDYVKDSLIEEYSKYPKDLKLITYRILLEKFNQKYDDLLPEQKNILREFINSMSSTAKLRNIINSELESLRHSIIDNLDKVDDIHKIKLNEIVKNMISIPNSEKIGDDALVNIMLYHDLAHELSVL